MKNQLSPFLTELHAMFYLSGGYGGGWEDMDCAGQRLCERIRDVQL